MKYLIKINLFLFVFFPLLVKAQIPYVHFDRISLEQGLKQGHVYDIHEGKGGFMWFATYAGLVKYDGYQFTNYKGSQIDSTALTSVSVVKAYEDKRGNMWIGTRNGANLFDTKTEISKRFYYPLHLDSVRLVVEFLDFLDDENNHLWMGTSVRAIAFSREENNEFIPYQAIINGKHFSEPIAVHSLFEDNQKNRWAGHIKRFYLKLPLPIKKYDQIPNTNDLIIYTLQKNKNGEIWIGCKTGLYELNPIMADNGKIALEKIEPT